MCRFLICFYNPNKFVSHTPRLEKGAVRQFKIAVCSQLRQRICCKAAAANKRRSPAVLQLRRRSGHRAAATAAPASLRGRRAGAPWHRENSREQQTQVPASPPADKDTVALQKVLCSLCRGIAPSLGPPVLAVPNAPSKTCSSIFKVAGGLLMIPPSPCACSSTSICISLSPPGSDSLPAKKGGKSQQMILFIVLNGNKCTTPAS